MTFSGLWTTECKIHTSKSASSTWFSLVFTTPTLNTNGGPITISRRVWEDITVNYKRKAKKQPRQLTITVKEILPMRITYWLLNDNSGEVFDFVIPTLNEGNLAMLRVGGQYSIKTAINHRGEYTWSNVALIKNPPPELLKPKAANNINQCFEF